MPTALITGVMGQDGFYLAHLLHERGYQVIGIVNHLHPDHPSLQRDLPFVQFVSGDLTDMPSLVAAFRTTRPDEVYNLAAQSSVELSFKQPLATTDVTAVGVLRLLEALKLVREIDGIEPRFYQASSSEMFGSNPSMPYNEDSRFCPQSPYAAAKVYAHYITQHFRLTYGQHYCCGILFNHESERRSHHFVTRKITLGVARVVVATRTGRKPPLIRLGNLESRRDWGFAGDYVEAMWQMLQHSEPGDFVVATGVSHSVRDFVDAAFAHVGINDWTEFVVERDQAYLREFDVPDLVGDATKARKVLGWVPRTTFAELVRRMVDADIRAVSESERYA